MTAPSPREASRRVAGRFSRWPDLMYYARCKLSWDPVYERAFQELSGNDLPLLDLGSGIGLLGLYLRERGWCGAIRMIELSDRKAEVAAEVAGTIPGIECVHGSISEPFEHRGSVAALDSIHYLPGPGQTALLARMAASVAPGGVAFVRTAMRDGSMRYRLTLVEEYWTRLSRWISGGAINFPTAADISPLFESAGLAVTVEPLWGRTPFNSHLFLGRRSRKPDEVSAG